MDRCFQVAFIRGWAKDKGLLMGLAYEAWDEISAVTPLASEVIVYGPRESVVSQLLNKYQAKVSAQPTQQFLSQLLSSVHICIAGLCSNTLFHR